MFEKARFAMAGVLVIVAAIFLAGCGSDDEASDTARSGATEVAEQGQGAATAVSGGSNARASRDIKIEEKDFSFEMPDRVSGGLVKISANNTGKEPHQAQLVRWNDGVIQGQIDAALRAPNFEPLMALITFMGGPNVISPGDSQVVYSNLQPGNYSVLCFIEGDDGVPHFAKGQVKNFTVVPGEGSDASPPKTNGTIVMADFNFLGDVNSLPDSKTTLEVKNGGPQPHELSVIKLKGGVTVDQLKAMLNSETPPAGPPPIEDAGGLSAFPANATSYIEFDLDKGNYAFVCFVPDPATGKPHAALGMIKGIEVK